MGIKQLTKLIQETAPGIVRECELKELTGRRVAIDASMAIYQFLVSRHLQSIVARISHALPVPTTLVGGHSVIW